MQSLPTNHRAGLALALVRPAGRTKRSLIISKNIKPALPHAKGSDDNAAIEVSRKANINRWSHILFIYVASSPNLFESFYFLQITSVSLALLMSLSASPALAESDSYEDMLKKFKSKQADTVKQYEKAAKTSSNLIALPSPPVSDKLPFSSIFGSGDKDTGAKSDSSTSTESVKPLSSFAAPKIEAPKMPDFTEKPPAFSAPKMPSFSSPKFDMPKVPDMPKMDIPKIEAPSVPAPAVRAVPKPISPPEVAVPTPPPVVAKPYIPPPPAPVPVAPRPAPVAPTPTPAPPSAAATSSQGDYMDRWQRDQAKSGSATKAVTTPSQRSSAESKKASSKKDAPAKKKAVSTGKRQGPLPLWFAEILMLALIAGFGAAVLFLQDSLKGAYVAADKAIAGVTANFNKRSE
jgi:hypothetical protein